MRPSKPSANFPLFWLERGLIARALWPLSQFFLFIAFLRRVFLRPVRLPVPVIVVGSITVGGSGKTPLTLWLAEQLSTRGYRPGIVSRGYGGSLDAGRMGGVQEVLSTSAAAVVGDEPLLLRQRSGLPVFVGRDRAEAAWALLKRHPQCNVILCDDGLQHYRLARDVELAVLDRRGLMNGWCLPAGPLRETPRRLASVDALVLNGTASQVLSKEHTPAAVFTMHLAGARFYRLGQPEQTCTAADLQGKHLHALAGIGMPQRFFDHLTSLGLSFSAHEFPDHHAYSPEMLNFPADALLTTEKDAVKLAALKLPAALPIWVLPVTAELDVGLLQVIVDKLRKVNGHTLVGYLGMPGVQELP